ncbi:MAG: PDZ domain-containing protein [Lachnospiraceae bacterium]
MELDQNENKNTMNSATPEAAPKTGEAQTEEKAQGTAEQGYTQQQANASAQGSASWQGNASSQAGTSQQGGATQQGPGESYHSAYEHYRTQEHPHPEHGGPGMPPMDDLHRELRHYRRMATTELVVIAVLAGLSAGLVTYTVTNRKSQDVIASQQETIRGMQEDQQDQGDESDSGSGSNSGSGAQMIPFFGGQEPGTGSGSDSGSENGSGSGSTDSGSGTEEEDPSSIETTVQLGIYCTGVTSDVSEAYDIPSGVVVADFSEENSNAEKAGLQKGDVITKIDDTEVTSVTELKKALQNYNPGDKVTLTIERRSGSDYQEKTISFKLEAKEDASDEATK